MMLDSGARTVHGIDISKEAIKYAAEYYNGKNLIYEVGDAEKLDGLQDNTFDMVVSFETIEHLINRDRYIDQIFRVLKSEGSLIISTPDRRLASTLYPLRGKPNNPYHIHEFTHDQFLNFLGKKFHVVECLGQAYVDPRLAFWPIQVFLKTIGYVFRRFGAYRFIERTFDVGAGLSVEPHRERKDMIARFWIARCIKMTGDTVDKPNTNKPC
jgi:SAM-dependent methyltransferase